MSGRQFRIAHGGFRAQVGQVAAVLREFSLVIGAPEAGGSGSDAEESGGVWAAGAGSDGRSVVHFTETWPDAWVAPMGCGMVLVPWPNRIAGGRWPLDGGSQQLDLTEPSKGNASHGLLRNTAYQPIDVAAESVTLGADIFPQHGYPFSLRTTVRYALSGSGLTVTHTLHNVGDGRAPFGVGAHPYLRVGDVPAADLRVQIVAGTRTVTEKQIPTRRVPVSGSGLDLSSGLRVGDLRADDAFTDLQATDGRVEHRLIAPDDRALVVWADADFGWVQVFTPPNFPGPGQPDQRPAVAVEPMTCAADAFNNGWGLRHLEPGESWSGSWGLRPEGFSA